MDYKDYYKVLGLKRKASEKEIKRAFRRLAREHHPDVNPDDPQAEERFKEINEAHEVLSDPEKRRKYDQLGADWQRWQQRGGRPGDFDWGRWSGGQPGGGGRVRYGAPQDLEDLFGGDSTFSDFFSQIFGGMGGGPSARGFHYQTRPQRGQDYEQRVEITLQEAYHGTRRVVQKEGQRLEIKIPAGAKTGTRVRMSGQGGVGSSGAGPGDLFLRVTVAPDPRFVRNGNDLHTTVTADLYTLILGGKLPVPTLSGDVVLTVPAGTQNGRVFRLRDKGMPSLRQKGQHGDLYATVEVELPIRLTAKEKELFEELQSESKS